MEWLLDKMRSFGDLEAIIQGNKSYSYKWIIDNIDSNQPKSKIAPIVSDFSPEACALLLSLIQNKNIIVPLSLELPQQTRFKFIREASTPNVLIRKLKDIGEPGLILFSSGSTGEPKATLHNFNRLLEKFKKPRPAFRTISFLMFDHIGGLNTIFHTLSNGGCLICLDNRSPDHVCRQIEKHKAELLPTTPTFLNMLLLSYEEGAYDLSSLKRITYGTEPMPKSTLTRLHDLLPDVTISQTYGLSELGILRTKSKDNTSLWMRAGGEGYQTKVVGGILHIKAESSMLGYLNAPNPFDENGWFNTGDQVEVAGEYIRILGRESEMINVGGLKVHPTEVESILLEMDNISDAIVYGSPNPIVGQIVIAKVVLDRPEEDVARRMRKYCKDRLPRYKIPVRVEVVDNLPSSRYKKVRR